MKTKKRRLPVTITKRTVFAVDRLHRDGSPAHAVKYTKRKRP